MLPIPYQRLTLAPVIPPQPLVVVSSASYATWGGLVVTSVIRSTPAPPVPSPVQTQSYTPPKIATVNGYNLLDIKNAPKDAWKASFSPSNAGFRWSDFNYYKSASSAYDWTKAGILFGGILGCGIAAIFSAGVAAAACMLAAPTGQMVGGIVGFVTGATLGGMNSPEADMFEWGPDQVTTPW